MLSVLRSYGSTVHFFPLYLYLSMDRPEHHSIDRLKERGAEKESRRHSTLQGRERSVFNQANIGTVSRAIFGRLLRDEVERVWAFPSALMPSWAEAETETCICWLLQKSHCGWVVSLTEFCHNSQSPVSKVKVKDTIFKRSKIFKMYWSTTDWSMWICVCVCVCEHVRVCT